MNCQVYFFGYCSCLDFKPYLIFELKIWLSNKSYIQQTNPFQTAKLRMIPIVSKEQEKLLLAIRATPISEYALPYKVHKS